MNCLNPGTDFDEANYQVLKDNQSRTTDLYLSYCGMERCEPDSANSGSPSADFLIHFILKGRGTFRLGAGQYPLGEGQAFFIPPDTSDFCYTADHDDPWTYAWIGFNGEQAQSYLMHTGLSASTPARTISPMEDISRVMAELLKTKALTLSNDIKRCGCLYKLLSLLIASYQSSQPGSSTHEYPAQTYAIYAKSYIDDNYGRTNITDIAGMIGIDRSYLHSVFKKNFQISPQEYLMQRRLEHAARQLRSCGTPIQQIAREVGYEDSLQFSKIFKKHYGQSPRAYRLSPGQEGDR